MPRSSTSGCSARSRCSRTTRATASAPGCWRRRWRTGRETGPPLLFLEGDPAFYGPRGFERADRHGFGVPSDRVPPAAFQVRRHRDVADGTTGRVVYPDVWWRHDAVGLRDPLLAQVAQGLA